MIPEEMGIVGIRKLKYKTGDPYEVLMMVRKKLITCYKNCYLNGICITIPHVAVAVIIIAQN